MQLTKEQADVYEAEINDNIVAAVLRDRLYRSACDIIFKLNLRKSMEIADVYISDEFILFRPLNRTAPAEGFDGFLFNVEDVVKTLGHIELFKKLMYFTNYVETLMGKKSKTWEYFMPTTARACNVDGVLRSFNSGKFRPFDKL